MRGDVSFEVILVRKTSPAYLALVSNAHVSVFIVVPVLSDRIETLVAIFAPVPELVQMPKHVLLDVLLVHERSEAEVANGPIRMIRNIVFVEFAVLRESSCANVAIIDVTLALLYMPEEDKLVDEELLAP